jgi:hypothetical protein
VFCKAKVGNLDVAVYVEKDVLWFQVAVHDVQNMEVVKGQGNLCGVEFCNRVGEALGSNQRQSAYFDNTED